MLYLAEERLTAYLERGEFQALRPNLRLLGALQQTRAAYGPDPLAPFAIDNLMRHGGVIGADWLAKYALVELSPRKDQRWLDLRSPYVIEQLRIVMADWLVQNGFADLQFRDLLCDINIDDPTSIPVTQVISQMTYDSALPESSLRVARIQLASVGRYTRELPSNLMRRSSRSLLRIAISWKRFAPIACVFPMRCRPS